MTNNSQGNILVRIIKMFPIAIIFGLFIGLAPGLYTMVLSKYVQEFYQWAGIELFIIIHVLMLIISILMVIVPLKIGGTKFLDNSARKKNLIILGILFTQLFGTFLAVLVVLNLVRIIYFGL